MKRIDQMNPNDPQPAGDQAVTDPIAEAVDYIDHWFQQLVAVQTRCFHCKGDSPVVFVPYGMLAFGKPVRRNDRDITKQAIDAFGKVGWRFQYRRSYCPTCKGLGSVT